jgi:hypothetical protein
MPYNTSPQRAAQLGLEFQQEDGANRAVEEIESYWNNYCVNGWFQKHVSCQANENDKNRNAIRTSYYLLAAGAAIVASAAIAIAAWSKSRK